LYNVFNCNQSKLDGDKMADLGNTLRILRKERGYSQVDLSDIVGVTRFTVANWESGRRTPSISLLRKLSTLYNVSLDKITETETEDNIATLITLAQSVFSNISIANEEKQIAFQAIMRSYLSAQEDMKSKR